MKIAMVSEHASPLAVLGGVDAGGQNVHVASLGAELAKRGHDVVVYTRRDDPARPDRVALGPRLCVEHVPCGPPAPLPKDELLPYLTEMIDDLTERLALDPPSLVHGHFWMSGLAAVAAAGELALPVVQTFHALGTVKRRWQGEEDTSPAERISAERRVARAATRIIASSTDEMGELIALGAPRPSIDVVPSGVDTSLFRPDGPTADRSHRPRLLVVGRLVPRKGVDDAIAALAELPGVELLIVGGPPVEALGADREASRLLRLADDHGVTSRVRLYGRASRNELPALIRSADLVVCAPWYEPFGIVPLEAMACGVPVIGTAVGGLIDTVIDGTTGILVPRRRPDLIAAAVASLLGDDARRSAYGAAGVRRTHEKYQWSAVARATERSYLHAVSEHRQPYRRAAGAVG
jgi:glycosyltransferase involved in cell wall biosynthesis